MVLNVDYDKRILFITINQINKRPRWMVENGIIDFYSLCFQNVISDIRSGFNPFKKRGYSMVLQHQNKSIILCFNRA